MRVVALIRWLYNFFEAGTKQISCWWQIANTFRKSHVQHWTDVLIVLFMPFVSGGKDSCYNMMQCVQRGHEIVALANLKPRDGGMWEWELLVMYRSIPKPPMPPPRANPRAFDFFEKFWSIPRYFASLDGQMPQPLDLQRGSNFPPARRVKANCGNKFCKIFNH